jgi:anti-anti-sigma factor
MAPSIKARQVGKITIVKPGERLMVGRTADAVDKKLQDAIAAGSRALLLDCGEVGFIDSQGIKVLVRAFTSLQRSGGKLRLLKLTPQVHKVLEITHLLTVMESFEDEAAALRSFDS